TWLTQWCDLDRTCEEFGKFSPRDAAAFRQMMTEYDAVKGIFGAYRYTPIGFGPTLLELIERHPQGARWVRRQAQSGWEIIRDAFQDWHTRAFMLWMTFMTMQPPDRPGTGWLAYSIPYGRQAHSWTMPKGGSAALPQALARCIAGPGRPACRCSSRTTPPPCRRSFPPDRARSPRWPPESPARWTGCCGSATSFIAGSWLSTIRSCWWCVLPSPIPHAPPPAGIPSRSLGFSRTSCRRGRRAGTRLRPVCPQPTSRNCAGTRRM